MNIETVRFIQWSEVVASINGEPDARFMGAVQDYATFTFGDAARTMISIPEIVAVLNNVFDVFDPDGDSATAGMIEQLIESLNILPQDILIDMEN